MNKILTKTTVDHIKTAGTKVVDLRQRILASKTMLFLLHFLEVQIPMVLGMIPWHPVVCCAACANLCGSVPARFGPVNPRPWPVHDYPDGGLDGYPPAWLAAQPGDGLPC